MTTHKGAAKYLVTNVAWLTAQGMTGSCQLRGSEATAGLSAAQLYLKDRVAAGVRHGDKLVSAVIYGEEVTRVYTFDPSGNLVLIAMEEAQ